jgi:type IV pilus assembly protein PilM|tara:strand:- start:2368 stop:3972 length:1605 start_codon:yes stop_codon:yes gene_type:complete
LENYWIKEVELSLNEPLLWLKAVSQSFEEIRLKFKEVSPVGYSLPGNLILTKYLKIPQASMKKRDKIVAFEAKQNIPYPIGEVAWDDCLIDEGDLDIETLIAASKIELVESLSRYGKEAKMDPDLIEPAFVGLINCFRFNEPQIDGCTLLLSIGAKSTDIIFFNGSDFYSRNVSLGGNTVTQEMRSALDLPFEDAERIKRLAIAGDPLPTGEHIAFEEAQKAFLKRLNVEISRTQAIYKNHGYEDEPIRCRLSGGGSLLPSIESTLNNRLGIPVERFDPLKRIRVGRDCPESALEIDKAFLSEAMGVAIGRFLPDSPEINLLPLSIVWQRLFKRQQPYFLAAGLVACAAVALPLVNTNLSLQRYREEIQNLDTNIAPLRELNAKIAERIEEIEKLRGVIHDANEVSLARSNWMRFLNDIQARLDEVEDVWLDRIEIVRSDTQSGSPSNRFNSSRGKATKPVSEVLKLRLEGRLLDVSNPLSTVSQESNKRVSALLESFAASEFIDHLENERFDNNLPGILKFNFTLVVDSTRPL